MQVDPAQLRGAVSDQSTLGGNTQRGGFTPEGQQIMGDTGTYLMGTTPFIDQLKQSVSQTVADFTGYSGSKRFMNEAMNFNPSNASLDDYINYLGRQSLNLGETVMAGADLAAITPMATRAASKGVEASLRANPGLFKSQAMDEGMVGVDNSNLYNWFGKSKVTKESGAPTLVHHGGYGAPKIKEYSEDYGGITTGNNEHGAFHFTDNSEVAGDYSRQSFIRRFQDNPEGLVDEGIIPQSKFDEIDAEGDWYGYVEGKAEEFTGTSDVFLKIERPLVLDMKGGTVDVEQIENLSRQIKDGQIPEELYDDLDQFIKIDKDDVATYKDEINERAVDNFGLDDVDEIEDYMFDEATREVLDEQGLIELELPDGIIIKNMVDDIGAESNQIADQYIVFDPTNIKSPKSKTFSPYDADIYSAVQSQTMSA